MSTRRGGQTKLNNSELIKCSTISLCSLTKKQLRSKFSVLYCHEFNHFTAISRLAQMNSKLCLSMGSEFRVSGACIAADNLSVVTNLPVALYGVSLLIWHQY